MFARCFMAVMALLIFTMPLVAQEFVVLQNGDRLSGSLQKLDNGILVMTTVMGETKIQWAAVQSLESSKLVYIRTSDGKIVSGQKIVRDGDQMAMAVAGQDIYRFAPQNLVMLAATRDGVDPEFMARQAKTEEPQSPWSGFLEVLFSGNEGNKNDRNFIGTAHTEYNTELYKFTAHLDLEYAQARRETIKNHIYGYSRDNYKVADRFDIFAQFSGEKDQISGIDVRLRGEAGITTHLLKEGDFAAFAGDKVTLDWDLGGHYTYTNYRLAENTTGAGIVTRVMYKHIFTNQWTLDILGEYYQSFIKPSDNRDNTDDYTLKGKVSLTVPITGILLFTASIWDEYNNVVSPGVKRNDFYWAFGLRFSI